MRFRTHLLASAAAGLALYPRRPWRLAALVLAGTLIDVDHLALYAMQTGDWSVTGALRYDRYRNWRADAGDARPRYGPLRSWLHEPWLLLPLLWLAATRRGWMRAMAVGLSLHLLLDHYDWPRRLLATRRAGGRCEGCQRRGLRLDVHRLGRKGRYAHVALCRACGQRALPPRKPDGAVVH